MGASKSTRRRSQSIPSSMAGDRLVLEASENSGRIVKGQLDVVKDERKIGRWMSGDPPNEVCRILLLGKANSGKSALINAIAGENIAEESHVRHGGKGVEVYTLAVKDQYLFVVESPGLFDGSEREEGHIEDIKSTVGRDGTKFHLVLYCHSITETDFLENDVEMIKLFTDILGDQLWSRCVVALTYVNKLQPSQEQLTERLDVCTSSVREGLERAGIPLPIVRYVPLVPVGIHCQTSKENCKILPDGTDWLHNLWEVISSRVSKKSKSILSFIETERFVPLGYDSVNLEHL